MPVLKRSVCVITTRPDLRRKLRDKGKDRCKKKKRVLFQKDFKQIDGQKSNARVWARGSAHTYQYYMIKCLSCSQNRPEILFSFPNFIFVSSLQPLRSCILLVLMVKKHLAAGFKLNFEALCEDFQMEPSIKIQTLNERGWMLLNLSLFCTFQRFNRFFLDFNILYQCFIEDTFCCHESSIEYVLNVVFSTPRCSCC